ncbi:MAG: GH3 auxin-responsive promoter family protein [Bacteroidales bacterium]|nr:GH3 auxin-responsive promoter family protein [Bacteroidales bacterium]MDD2425734.1 GH3 auxin-responsive promoter family protein [Bacteroidales bacterium]MDD3989622.1 GH3 auxin-responsive promoter family protein [Bacteroidales bacterium]MDD4639082.1 GH3 auxin-responsive promoter family protein [Bacteroidales bacterium]
MAITTSILNLYFRNRLAELDKNRKEPWLYQQEMFKSLINSGSSTSFGREHNFSLIKSIEDYQNMVPLRNYDSFEPYINRLRNGEDFVLWNSRVKWFAKSSGTSSAKSKFIPVTDESLQKCHYEGFKKMLASYLDSNPRSRLLEGKSLTLGGSVKIDESGNGKSRYGDLSAILISNSPPWAELKRAPGRSVALTEDFEQKIEQISKIAATLDVTNFSGVPSWNLVLINKILEYNGKSNLLEIWPNLELFMHGGISFDPYREIFKRIIPDPQMNYRENYNASEGYFGFQDDPSESSLLLLTNNGVFYEFIPMNMLVKALEGSYTSFDTAGSVSTGVNYAVVISTNGGLWRYLLGDCIIFTSLKPHKFIISGRTQLFINAFGEELMISNAEKALSRCCTLCNVEVLNYTVAPLFMEERGKGSHQWVIEFTKAPDNIEEFAKVLDESVSMYNSDYESKRYKDATMKRLTVTPVSSGVFYRWMRERGKLGGQNKVPRLSNERHYVEQLIEIDRKPEETTASQQ